MRRVRTALLDAHPSASWYEYQADSRDNEREGTRLAHGAPMRPIPHLDRVRVVAAFDADPLFEHPAALRLAREFADSRSPQADPASRLYVAESRYSLTGGRADHRLAIASSQVPQVLAAVARSLNRDHGVEIPESLAEVVGMTFVAQSMSRDQGLELPDSRTEVVGTTKIEEDFATSLAADLAAHHGDSLILVGHRQPPEVHALAAVLNRALGNIGKGISYIEDSDPDRPTHFEAIVELAQRIRAGEVDSLLILGGNPAYDAPAELGFAELIASVPLSIHLSCYDDETSRLCRWHLPRAHHLECWGDGRGWDGTWTFQQPLIAPLYDGVSPIQLVGLIIRGQLGNGHEMVRDTARSLLGSAFENDWRRWLHDGVVKDSGIVEVEPELDRYGLAKIAVGLSSILETEPPSLDRLELVMAADSKVGDGSLANNGWLQELSDSVTKICWDNALLMSPATGRELGLAQGDVVELGATHGLLFGEDRVSSHSESQGLSPESIELPVCVVPGHARYSLSVALGYGRSAAGRVGTGVGVNAYRLRRSNSPHLMLGASIRPAGRSHRLATTQDHHAIDALGFSERNIRVANLVREATLDAYLADPEIFHHMDHHPPLEQLWQGHVYQGEQWGMAIDLNACTGCNACVVACQAENNIPLVGREQVINQREMHWIRIDRYFKTEPGVGADEVDDAGMVFQPVTCVHCENAPCEQVCPVAATQHTEDGLNAMAYNRCIGTRYCSNNCPFKVRRFNFFNYHKDLAETSKMQFNPEVTVRARGVMEKCTFCIQRIQSVRIAAGNERRPIADGEITPACAQSCPAKAIHFGNLNDESSEVSKLRAEPRSYAALAELNIRPRVHYLARLGNPTGSETGAGRAPEHGEDLRSSLGKDRRSLHGRSQELLLGKGGTPLHGKESG
jgi:molybdopterin-containing oxidoreductase family iron-sulfur binding subunit